MNISSRFREIDKNIRSSTVTKQHDHKLVHATCDRTFRFYIVPTPFLNTSINKIFIICIIGNFSIIS